MTPRRTAFLAAVGAFAAFLPALSNGFVLDDVYYVVLNPVVAAPGRWWTFWTTPTALLADANLAGQVWRPLAGHWFGLLAWGLGKNPFWFHLGAALLHAVSTALVALLAASLAGPAAALPAAVLFALHPAQAEAVAYAGNTPGLLAGAGVLLALLLHEGGRRRTAVAVGAAALLCRESAAVLPFLIWAWDRCRSPKVSLSREAGEGWGEGIPPHPALSPTGERENGLTDRPRGWVPHAGVLAAFAVARTLVLGAVAQRSLWGGSWPVHLKLSLQGLGMGLGHVVWPAGLRVCYSFSEAGGLVPAATAALGLAALAWGALCGLRARRPWAFGLCFGLASLIPVSNLVPIDALAADRFLYMPLAGLALTLGAAASAWTPLRRGAASAALTLAFLPALLSAQVPWQDNFTLDLAAYAAAPEDPCAPLNLSAHYFNWGMLGRARALAVLASADAAPSHVREEARRRVGLCDAVSAARTRGRAP
ncbi:hypothetical protein EPO15_16800 [bacterium]|nr:MAG: hypothetical protein EPO15_16800 [bacterium]